MNVLIVLTVIFFSILNGIYDTNEIYELTRDNEALKKYFL